MNDNQGHDVPNVATLNVTDITNVKHLLLSDNDQRKSLFVCVEVLRPSQPNGVMSNAVSLPNHTFTGQA